MGSPEDRVLVHFLYSSGKPLMNQGERQHQPSVMACGSHFSAWPLTAQRLSQSAAFLQRAWHSRVKAVAYKELAKAKKVFVFGFVMVQSIRVYVYIYYLRLCNRILACMHCIDTYHIISYHIISYRTIKTDQNWGSVHFTLWLIGWHACEGFPSLFVLSIVGDCGRHSAEDSWRSWSLGTLVRTTSDRQLMLPGRLFF